MFLFAFAFVCLTEKITEPLRLMIMFDGNANGVEEHENDDKPVERLGLDSVSYPKPKSLLCTPELQAGTLIPYSRLEVGSSRESYKSTESRLQLLKRLHNYSRFWWLMAAFGMGFFVFFGDKRYACVSLGRSWAQLIQNKPCFFSSLKIYSFFLSFIIINFFF